MIPNFNKLPGNDFVNISNQNQAIERFNKVSEYLKIMFNCKYVFACDVHPLSTWFDKNKLNMHSFESAKNAASIDGYTPQIREYNKIRVLVIDLVQIGKYFDFSFCGGVVGYNGNRNNAVSQEENTFFDDKLNLIIYYFEEYAKRLAEQVERNDLERVAWKHFEEVKKKMSSKRLGQEFEVLKPIYWHFLECLPPIYGKGCFYCSEAYTHTDAGETVYYCLRQTGNKYYISFDILR
jgi:hypothetical protein